MIWTVVRHALAIAVLPFTVTVVVPAWIVRARAIPLALPDTAVGWASFVGGGLVLLAGGTLFVACVTRFGQVGSGTLAPWDPPRHLVVDGAYAYSRNPMISGVILILVAEAMLLRSLPHLQWAGIFFLINATYIPLVEEPMLHARFGGRYAAYARNVPRLFPRLRPYREEGDTANRSPPGSVSRETGKEDDG